MDPAGITKPLEGRQIFAFARFESLKSVPTYSSKSFKIKRGVSKKYILKILNIKFVQRTTLYIILLLQLRKPPTRIRHQQIFTTCFLLTKHF